MRIARRRWLAASLAAFAVAVAPAATSAALLWTLVASPLAVTTGAATTFTLTATNLDLLSAIRCVVLDVPGTFAVDGSSVVGSSAGDSWTTSRVGNQVRVWTTSGGDELRLAGTVTFTVHATALSAGSPAWAANAYGRSDCGGSPSVLGIPPIVVVTGPAVTPTPTPTPVATPTSTQAPVPTLIPTLGPTLPSLPPVSPALPSLPAGATSSPSAALPTASSIVPARSTTSPGPSSSAGGVPSAGAAGPGTPAPSDDSRSDFDVPGFDADLGGVAVGGFDVGLGVETWAVPAVTLGLSGLLVLLWVAAQTIGALAWIPAVRRLRGDTESSAG